MVGAGCDILAQRVDCDANNPHTKLGRHRAVLVLGRQPWVDPWDSLPSTESLIREPQASERKTKPN